MSDDDFFYISAEPSLRTVSPGATITYQLYAKLGSPVHESEVSARWYAINDPAVVTFLRPQIIPGPSGIDWEDAVWSVPGHHRIVCEVSFQGKTVKVTYEQWVAPLASFLDSGPQLPQPGEDPATAFDGVSRLIDVMLGAAAKFPAQTKEKQDEFADTLAQLESFRDKLKERLASTKNFVRHAFTAEHFDAKTQKRTALRVFLSQVEGKRWRIVDWTNPMVRGATGEYDGVGDTPLDAVKDAISDWNDDNRYPDGGITLTIPQIRDLPALKANFATDGSAFWDSVASFFGWVGLGAAIVAGVVTLVAPVPGSQLVSAAIWTSIFSSTAAAVINIGTRIDEGFSSFRANAFDVLTIVGNLFGAFGVIWSRGAPLLVQTERGLLKGVIIGQITTNSVQGVMLGADHVERFKKIESDPTLSPHQRTMALLELFRAAAIDGVLLYVSVKAGKLDLDNLNVKGNSVNAQTPAEKLAEFGNPNAKEIDLTQRPKVEGTSKETQKKTRVNVDEEAEAAHSGGRAKAVRVRSEDDAFKDAIGHAHHAQILAEVPQIRATRPEVANLTDNEIIAIRGYTLDTPKPEFQNQRDYERINAAMRFNDAHQLAILAPYIKFITSGLKKLPTFQGKVSRMIQNITVEEAQKQFVAGKEWVSDAFMSTSRGDPLDKAVVILSITGTKTGRVAEGLSRFPEREVVFLPGTKFKVEGTIPVGPFLLVLMKEL